MEFQEWIAAGIFVVLIVASYFYGKRKGDNLANFATDILSIMNFVISQTGFKNKALMSEIILHTKEAIAVVAQAADITDVDIALEMVQNETIRICEENGIKVDNELLGVIEVAAKYVLGDIKDNEIKE